MVIRNNLEEHYNREHYNANKKAKIAYETEEYAKEICLTKRYRNYSYYLCKVCNKFHLTKNKEWI